DEEVEQYQEQERHHEREEGGDHVAQEQSDLHPGLGESQCQPPGSSHSAPPTSRRYASASVGLRTSRSASSITASKALPVRRCSSSDGEEGSTNTRTSIASSPRRASA